MVFKLTEELCFDALEGRVTLVFLGRSLIIFVTSLWKRYIFMFIRMLRNIVRLKGSWGDIKGT